MKQLVAVLPLCAALITMTGVGFAQETAASAFLLRDVVTVPAPVEGCGRGLVAHDRTLENAYAWAYEGVQAPDRGAFAMCFEGDYDLCEAQFYFTQIGNQAGQTMDVFVWADDNTGSPGPLLYQVSDVSPGTVATWPEVSRHDVPLDVTVSGTWWLGWWGNWPGQSAGWLITADEDGPAGCPRTNVASGQGYPAGWEHPEIVIAWENCRTLGIQALGDTSGPVGAPEVAIAPMAGAHLARIGPNPFARTARIQYEIPTSGAVTMTILDVAGRRVRTLLRGSSTQGIHDTQWDGTGDNGRRLPAGTYFIRLTDEFTSDVSRVVLIR